MECGPQIAILWLGPFSSHVTPEVDQTLSSLAPLLRSASGGADSGVEQTWKSGPTPALISRTPPTCILLADAQISAHRGPHPSAWSWHTPGGAELPASSRPARARSRGAGGMAFECARVGAERNPGALETSGGLPAGIRSWKGSATTRRRARERRGFAIKTPALLRVRSGRTPPPAPRGTGQP